MLSSPLTSTERSGRQGWACLWIFLAICLLLIPQRSHAQLNPHAKYNSYGRGGVCDYYDCDTGRYVVLGKLSGRVGTLGLVKSNGLGSESADGQYYVWAEYLPGETVALDKRNEQIIPWSDEYLGDYSYSRYYLPGNTVEIALAQGPLERAHVVSTSLLHDLWVRYEEIEEQLDTRVVPVDSSLESWVRDDTTHVYRFKSVAEGENPVALEFPANPDAAEVASVRYSYNPNDPEQVRSLLVDDTGFVHHGSVGTIAYLTDYFTKLNDGNATTDDIDDAYGYCGSRADALTTPNDPTALWRSAATNKTSLATRFGLCNTRRVGELLAPVPGAQVELISYFNHFVGGIRSTYVDRTDGRFTVGYGYPYKTIIQAPIYVTVPLEPFDEQRTGVKHMETKTVGIGLTEIFRAQRGVNFAVDTASVQGAFEVNNVFPLSLPPGDEVSYYSGGEPIVSVGVETLYEEAPPPKTPVSFSRQGGVQRHEDFVADLHHRGLLREIATEDLLNTDAYIFPTDSSGRPLDGVSGSSEYQHGQNLYRFHRRGMFPPESPSGEGGAARLHPLMVIPHPGQQYFKLYLVNRVTGYVGSAPLRMVNRVGQQATQVMPGGPSEGLVAMATVLRLPDGSEVVALPDPERGEDRFPTIPMLPPNITVHVERQNARVVDNREQTVGFEGGGLTDDTIKMVIDWRDYDGSPLPSGLPGFSGRLSVAHQAGNALTPVSESTLGRDVSHFEITPGKNIEVVRVPDMVSNQHYYLHVHAVSAQSCRDNTARPPVASPWFYEYGISAACLDLSSGVQQGALQYRPKNYVPIKVPIFDEAATLDELQALADQIRSSGSSNILAYESENENVFYEAVKPTYRYLYRPEMQFSLYDIPVEQPDATVVTDLNGTVSQTALDFEPVVQGPEGPALPSWGDDSRTLLWGIGYGEYLALTDGEPHAIACTEEAQLAGDCELNDLDRLVSLTPAGQIGTVAGIAGELTAADYLAIQLYSAGDAGNVLYEFDLGYPLVSARSKFLDLKRQHDQSRLDLQRWTDTYEVVNFTVNEAVKVKGKVLRPDGAPAGVGDLPFINDVPLVDPGPYSFVVDYSTIIQFISDQNAAADSTAPNFIVQLEFTKIDDPNPSGATHIVRYPGRLSYEKVGEPVGQYVQHQVNLNDGSLHVGTTDFSIPGAGPTLDFHRSYSNLNREGAGVLGPGWTHSLDQRLVPLGTDFVQNGLPVPDWVAQYRGRISPAPPVESAMLSEGGRELGKLQVNGTVFQYYDGKWKADPGRFGELEYDARPCSAVAGSVLNAADDPTEPAADLPGCFVFKARDGTEYFYDEPKMVLGEASPDLSNRYLLSLYDRLAYRVGMTDLFIESEPELVAAGLPSSPWQPTPVRLIRDRYGEELVFEYNRDLEPDATGRKPEPRLERVTDIGADSGSDRECQLFYDTAPSGCSSFEGRLGQIRCLSSRPIVVDFCYDENGYLTRAQRGNEWEEYSYLKEKHTDPEEPECTVQTSPDLSDNLAHCPFNLVRISDETGNFTAFDYFESEGPDLGLDALEERSYGEVVRKVTYADTVVRTGDPSSEIDIVYDGLVREIGHMRSDLTGAQTTLTLNQRGNVELIEEPIVGGNSAGDKVTVRSWYSTEGDPRFGLLEYEEVSDDRLTLRTTYDYDEHGNVSTQSMTGTGLQGSVDVDMTWTADAQLLSRSESRNGVSTKTESWGYDGNGFRTSYTDSQFDTWGYEAHPVFAGLVGKETSPSDPPIVIDYDYDGYGNEISKTIGGDRETKTPRNERGEVESRTDPEGNEWDYSYNENGRLLATILPADISGTATNPSMTYLDESRLVETETDQNGLTLTYTYTARNQIETISRSEGGGIKRFYYDGMGSIVAETDWNGVLTTHEFDSLGTRLATTNRVGDSMSNPEVDGFGNVWRSRDYAAVITTFTYDALGRELTRLRDGCGSRGDPCGTVTSVHDQSPEENGRYSTVVNGEDGVDTRTSFDGNGRIVSVKRGDAETTTEYDGNGRPTKVTDAGGFCTWHKYDKYGDKVATLADGDDCDGRGYLTRFTYDGNGQLKSLTKWPDSDGSDTIENGSGGRTAVTTYEYDGLGRLKRETPPSTDDSAANGVAATYEYNGEGLVTKMTDYRGAVRSWERNTLGWVTRFRDAALNAGGPDESGCGGTACYGAFDGNGNPREITGARGAVTMLEYDAEDRPTSVVEASNRPADSRTTSIESYDGMGNPTRVVQGGVTTLMTYNGRHDLHTQTVVGESSIGNEVPDLVRTLTYGVSGLLRAETISDGIESHVRTNVYDENNFLKETYYPDDCGASPSASSCTLESSQTNDAVGNVLTQTSQTGATTTNDLDPFYRVDTVTLSGPDQVPIIIADNDYDGLGNVTRTVDAKGNITTFTYDVRGRRLSTVMPQLASDPESEAERTETRRYDPNGNLREIVSPSRSTEPVLATSFEYDAENRKTKETTAGEETSFSYDAAGNMVSQTLPAQQGLPESDSTRSTIMYFDSLERLKWVRDRLGNVTSYAYDDRDNQVRQTVTPVVGPVVVAESSYDSRNNVERITQLSASGDIVTEYSGYNVLNNPRFLTDANQRTLEYDYDHQGRRISAIYPTTGAELAEARTISWAFDDQLATVSITETKAGLVDETVMNHSRTWGYPTLVVQRGHEISYDYDDNGNRTSVETAHGDTFYDYDSRNRLTSVEVEFSGVTNYSYYPDGRPDSIYFPNGVVTTATYWPTRRVQMITHSGSTDGIVSVGYRYDPNGNREWQAEVRPEGAEETEYLYDALDRLREYTIGANAPINQTTAYAFQGYNRTKETVSVEDGGASSTIRDRDLVYDDLDRLNHIDEHEEEGGYAVDYTYDANGNTVGKVKSTEPENALEFSYDSRDQLVQIARGPPGEQVVVGQYDYNHAGQRVRSRTDVSGRESVDYVHDDQSVLEEFDGDDGQPLARYHYGSRAAVAIQKIAGPDAGVRYYHTDAAGTTTHLTNEDGAIVTQYKVDPWGRPRAGTDVDQAYNRKLFTGHEYDSESELYYAKARYYDPDSGRFLTQDSYMGDPGNPPSLHRYLYAYSNPAAYADPTGHWPEWMDEWARETDILTNPVFHNLAERGKALVSAPGVLMDKAAEAGDRIGEAYQSKGVIGAVGQTVDEGISAGGAILGAFGDTIKTTGQALGDIAYNCTPGDGKCDAEMASRAVDAVLGAADIGLTLVGGGTALVKATTTATKTLAVTKQTLKTATQLGVKESLRVGGKAVVTSARAGAQTTIEALSGARTVAIESVTKMARGVGNMPTKLKQTAQAARATTQSSVTRVSKAISSGSQKLADTAQSAMQSVRSAFSKGRKSSPCSIAAGTLILGATGEFHRIIDDVEVGDRVFVAEGADTSDVDPRGYRLIVARYEAPDGDVFEMQVLRPVSWVREMRADTRSRIPMAAFGFSHPGAADILAVQEAPVFQDGPGRLVLSKFTHTALETLEISLRGDDASPLVVTPVHELWSVADAQWVAVSQLRIGDEVQTKHGTSHIVGIEPRAGPQQVFDIEVEKEHLYYAGEDAVMVHNCPVDGASGGARWKPAEVGGRRVYQRNDLIDPTRRSAWVDPGTKQWTRGTNVQRMEAGLAPVDGVGRPIQLHHITGQEVHGMTGARGPLAELTEGLHRTPGRHIPTLTRNPNVPRQTIPRYPSFRRNNLGGLTDEAAQFDQFRGEYWRLRASDFK